MGAWQQWYQGGERVRLGRWNVFVREQGAGEPLLLIHGFPTSSWDWCELAPELAQHYRLISLDLLGFGRSDKPANHAYRIAEQADLCEALLAHFACERVHILAHDYGDTVAQELLARAGEGQLRSKLLSVAFLNGGLFPECHRPLRLQTLLLGPLGPLLSRLTSKRRFAASMRHIFGRDTAPTEAQIEGFWTLLCERDGRLRIPALLRYIPERSAQRRRWVGALSASAVPLAFINGNADPISGAHMAQRWQKLLPDAALMNLPEIGHYPQLEAANDVLKAYLAWRDQLDNAAEQQE